MRVHGRKDSHTVLIVQTQGSCNYIRLLTKHHVQDGQNSIYYKLSTHMYLPSTKAHFLNILKAHFLFFVPVGDSVINDTVMRISGLIILSKTLERQRLRSGDKADDLKLPLFRRKKKTYQRHICERGCRRVEDGALIILCLDFLTLKTPRKNASENVVC